MARARGKKKEAKKNEVSLLPASPVPALYLYGVNSFCMHSIPRYNQPIIPILVVALLFVVHLLVNKRGQN